MKKILVVDNESQIRKLIRQMLKQSGYEVCEARDKQRAIELFRENPADVVLVDCLLSTKEVMETIVELKRVCFSVAIIVMSRESKIVCSEKLLALTEPFEAVSILPKPFKQNDLLRVIKATLQAADKCQKESPAGNMQG